MILCRSPFSYLFFFFNDTATTEIYTLSLHDALPIYAAPGRPRRRRPRPPDLSDRPHREDRKSTRLNSSHQIISYAVFCLKKKKKQDIDTRTGRDHPQGNPQARLDIAHHHRASARPG